jgi:hypothetical protein
MPSKIAEDPRIDPRIKEVFSGVELRPQEDVASREELLADDAFKEEIAALQAMLNSFNNETIAPSAGLSIRRRRTKPQSRCKTLIRNDCATELKMEIPVNVPFGHESGAILRR